MTDLAALRRAAQGCDIVFHVAAKPGIWGPYQEYYRTNVVGTENVLAVCRQLGIARLVYTSTPSVVFDGKDQEGIDESAPYPAPLSRSLSTDEGPGRAAGAAGE